MRRNLIGGLACAAVLAIGGCSSATPLSGTESGTPEHTTMALSTLGTSGDTHQHATVGSTPSGSTRTTGPGGSATTLPGLSADCTAVIQAQAAVSKLFSDALGAPDSTGSGSGDATPEDTTADSSTTTSGEGSDTTSPSPSPDDTTTAATPLTDQSVADTFDRVEQTVPAELADAFGTLRTTAESVIGKSAADVSSSITKPEVLKALSAISDYISGCTPTTP